MRELLWPVVVPYPVLDDDGLFGRHKNVTNIRAAMPTTKLSNEFTFNLFSIAYTYTNLYIYLFHYGNHLY